MLTEGRAKINRPRLYAITMGILREISPTSPDLEIIQIQRKTSIYSFGDK
jgi:hypothetical protein